MGKAKSIITPEKPKHGGGYVKHGKFVGAHKAKMDKKAAAMGMRYENGKFYPLEVKKPDIVKPAPVAKAPEPPPMRVITEEDTFKNEFFSALEKTSVPVEPEPEPVKEPAKEKSWFSFGDSDDEAEASEEKPRNPHSDPEPEPEPKEEPPPGFGFEFDWDDEDVDKALDMIPLITIPISSIIAWFFGRTLNPEMITMPEWKRNLLRPGVKHYGAKIMQAISTPEFFWTALVGLIIFDAIFNSTKDPEGPKNDHREPADPDEEEFTDHREVA